MKQYNCRSDCTRFREAFDEGPSSRALYSILRHFALHRILISKIFALIVQCHASLSIQEKQTISRTRSQRSEMWAATSSLRNTNHVHR